VSPVPVSDALYPVNLIVAGRRCVVVGGGAVAARKAAGLMAAGAAVEVIATVVGEEVRASGAAWQQRPYRAGDLEGAWLAIVATDDPVVNGQVRHDGDAAGVWVNAADDPASCSFTLPSVVRQGPIMVTVATGGHSPALAQWLRRHVEAELGEEYVVLLTLLSEQRAQIKAEGRSTEGLDWLSALDSNMLELIRAGQLGKARERLQACLSSS
jgi:precorrin-2 dehydrogenase / sirohydrochlorin ferrochelatase